MGGVQPPGGSGTKSRINILTTCSRSCIKTHFLFFPEQALPSCRVQQLLVDSFPEKEVPEAEEEEEGEVLSLGRHMPDCQEREETQHIHSTFHS